MMKTFSVLLALCACVSLGRRHSRRRHLTPTGDEESEALHHGAFVVFANRTIYLVDPDSAVAFDRIEVDVEKWGDPAASGISDEQMGVIPAQYEDKPGELWTYEFHDHFEIMTKLPLGERPVHTYWVDYLHEWWVHPDGDGHFDILSPDDIEKLDFENLKAYAANPSHGKLVWDEEWAPIGFATTTEDPGIHELDLQKREYIKFHNLSQPIDDSGVGCEGTHAIAHYANNEVILIECSRPSDARSIWEFDFERRQPIQRFNFSGPIYPVPQYENSPWGYHSSLALVGDKNNDRVHILRKDNASADTEVISIEVPGGPGKTSFINTVDDPDAPADWLAFVALESNRSDSGVAVLDLGRILEGDLTYDVIKVGPGNKYRPIERGGDRWIATPVADEETGSYSGLAIIDALTREFRIVPNINDTSRLIWMADWSHYAEENEIHELHEYIEELEHRIEQLERTVGSIGNTPSGGERRSLRKLKSRRA
ncbi:unnamed protein product [Vitrella brassicaformis CCMP3155]|uniref:Uncharacterized protein n=2 Tax=Vitrella brassicaformis TaxID=1169539 RepID=A0A0G4EDE1_VITBC|nr:unnamed protein product [Vitrella brassicaformis CCMP3155]|eukprot:CEL93720.1 unnamed protein product [Vitrella brassicaformis CCMP3155]